MAAFVSRLLCFLGLVVLILYLATGVAAGDQGMSRPFDFAALAEEVRTGIYSTLPLFVLAIAIELAGMRWGREPEPPEPPPAP